MIDAVLVKNANRMMTVASLLGRWHRTEFRRRSQGAHSLLRSS